MTNNKPNTVMWEKLWPLVENLQKSGFGRHKICEVACEVMNEELALSTTNLIAEIDKMKEKYDEEPWDRAWNSALYSVIDLLKGLLIAYDKTETRKD